MKFYLFVNIMASINNLNEQLFEAKKTKNKLKKINVFFVRYNNAETT